MTVINVPPVAHVAVYVLDIIYKFINTANCSTACAAEDESGGERSDGDPPVQAADKNDSNYELSIKMNKTTNLTERLPSSRIQAKTTAKRKLSKEGERS